MREDPNAQATFAAVCAFLRQREPAGDLLDVGCGGGNLLKCIAVEDPRWRLSGCGWEVAVPTGTGSHPGIDLNALGWATGLPGGYAAITATDVIEHLLNPCQFLRELRRLTASDGVLILTFPNVHSLRSRLAFAMNGRFTGFFGPNFNSGHPVHDQHIWVPNLHLLRYFLSLTGWTEITVLPVHGRSLLTCQTTLFAARPSGEPRI